VSGALVCMFADNPNTGICSVRIQKIFHQRSVMGVICTQKRVVLGDVEDEMGLGWGKCL
jgi:hypothetical protein